MFPHFICFFKHECICKKSPPTNKLFTPQNAQVTSAALLRIGCNLCESNASEHSADSAATAVFRATRAAKGATLA